MAVKVRIIPITEFLLTDASGTLGPGTTKLVVQRRMTIEIVKGKHGARQGTFLARSGRQLLEPANM